MKRYHITVGAKTTVGGTVVSGWHRGSIFGQNLAREGDQVKSPECGQEGWIPIRLDDFPSFADTPQWRARLRDVSIGGTAYWRADDKYQVMLGVNRFRDDKQPTDERYLITLHLAAPWGRP